jgi:hypothetical protein
MAQIKTKRVPRSVFLLAAGWIMTSCTLFSPNQEITISPPDPLTIPLTSHSRLIGWQVTVSGAGADSEYGTVPHGKIRLEVPRDTMTLVLLHPVLEPGGRLGYPAGTVVKPGWSGQDVRATWRGGWTASLLAGLVRQGFDPDRFQGLRLLDEIKQRDISDPWLYDSARLASAFSTGNFTLYELVCLPLFSVELLGLPEGFILPENPFSDPVMVTSGTGCRLVLPAGTFRYWLPDKGGWATIVVNDQGIASCMLIPSGFVANN